MKYKTKQPRSLMPFILIVVFTGLALFSFSPRFASNGDPHQIGKYYVTMPDSLPKENGLYWTQKQGDTLNIQPYSSREYQIELNLDSTEIWDGDRLVGKIVNGNNAFDSLFAEDNR